MFINTDKFITINDAYFVCIYTIRGEWCASNDAYAVAIAYISRGLLAAGVWIWLEDEVVECYIHIL